jgi:hypothetical protein
MGRTLVHIAVPVLWVLATVAGLVVAGGAYTGRTDTWTLLPLGAFALFGLGACWAQAALADGAGRRFAKGDPGHGGRVRGEVLK